MKIFISFSKKDDKVLQAFVDHILKLGLKLNNSEIICTGIEDSNPKTGDDFKVWIKENIIESDAIIQLISQNYKSSEVCLNEMGAAWILDKKVIPLLLDPIDYKTVGFIHNTTQLLKIDKRDDLLKLKDDLDIFLKKKKITIVSYCKQVDIFLSEVKLVPIFDDDFKNKSIIGTAKDFSFFKHFLNPELDYRSLLLQSQPTLNDCKQVFREDIYKDIYHYYSFQFRDLLSIKESVHDLSGCNIFDTVSADYNQLKSNNHDLPGGMSLLVKHNAIKKNILFYSVRFRNDTEKNGISFSAWVYINNRWILFIKPWIIIEFIQAAKSNEDLTFVLQVLKRFKFFKEFTSFEVQFLINKINE